MPIEQGPDIIVHTDSHGSHLSVSVLQVHRIYSTYFFTFTVNPFYGHPTVRLIKKIC